jgi:hypothetical protein
VSAQLVGVLIGGGITLIAGMLGQAASHALTLRRERESRRAARLTDLADVRIKAILELQQLAGEACADAVTRPSVTSEKDLTELHARIIARMVGLKVPTARINDTQTDTLSETLVSRLTEVNSAYDNRRPSDGAKALVVLPRDLDALIHRTRDLLEAERSKLETRSER